MSDSAQHNFEASPIHKGNTLGISKTIVLVGLMGAGKTTIGRRLAKRLDLEFIDSDFEIEKAAQMTVSEIFETYGEEDFRAGERRVIARLMEGPAKIIATGGGAFINAETRALIKEHSISIWLDASLDILVERTARRDTRPLLQVEDPRSVLENLLNERSPIYGEADMKVQSCDGPHETVVDAIVRKLTATEVTDA
ncbi:shikimate kinase [Kordiimonas aquimaris]|uniref:shikimate kinase n=1 Tax=Kordiimonas aquimaris TaxID=707591 RepID=UPI0021CE0F9C|nr:shikimate kinase [Kordiimonas aquimaris]